MAEITFWSSVALVLYTHLGYPLALMALSLIRNRPVEKGSVTPRVSFIIAAHNEGSRIRGKVENTLGQNYPAASLEIIVASDCSTDRTDEIVRSYSDRVRLVRAPERRGKEAAQQLAVEAASGEILVFSDVATALAADGVSSIVRNFADPTVGCVSSVDRFIDPDGRITGEGAYVRYEMFLRTVETRVNSLVGLSGSFFAARREVCRKWAADRQSDFSTLLNAVDMGLRGVLDPDSAGYYRNIVDDRREFQRKVRTVVRGISVLAANVRMLNPVRYGLFSWQLLSHKVCRWLVPFAMIVACLSNALLVSRSPVYRATFVLQLGFYAAALGGVWTGFRVLRIPSFLLMVNLAILTAWFRYARGERITSWSPSERMRALPQTDSR
ncbi:MAG: glycosyl transferase [Actinobacteria bacterium 13_1_20CM_2_65_11]|nr:MAG: glycosyl transferase [Actinobacteria bacterium 13_1_40CM_4_65_12]OLE78024.1 MAG: glycosyl transferase [Actinobacteria bacterium 13_1_20CM_2_65_11]